MTAEELREIFGVPSKECSCGCGKNLTPDDMRVNYHINDGLVREDCYYRLFGEEIERHPICSPRVHRG